MVVILCLHLYRLKKLRLALWHYRRRQNTHVRQAPWRTQSVRAAVKLRARTGSATGTRPRPRPRARTCARCVRPARRTRPPDRSAASATPPSHQHSRTPKQNASLNNYDSSCNRRNKDAMLESSRHYRIAHHPKLPHPNRRSMKKQRRLLNTRFFCNLLLKTRAFQCLPYAAILFKSKCYHCG